MTAVIQLGGWTIAADIFGWLVIHLGVSYLFTKLPDRWFTGHQDSIPQPIHSSFVRREIQFAEQVLRIRKWKDRLPDGSRMFAKGFAKKHLGERTEAYYRRYMLEARRGEWSHLVSILPAPVFFLWHEPLYGWIIIAYAIAANLPCLIALRYNRLRLARILIRSKGKSE